MRKPVSPRILVLALWAAVALAPAAARADKPAWAGAGKPDKHEKGERRERDDDRERRERSESPRESRSDRDHRGELPLRFDDRQRVVIHDYYTDEIRSGRCPPGLAKKHNGCMPPGQAKKWSRGRPLPAGVAFHELPPAIAVKLGKPPAGHRFVRVATDILLIAVGTSLVVDAIEDLGRM